MKAATGLEEYLRYKIAVLAAFPSFPKIKPVERPEFCNDLFVDSGAFGKHGDKVNINGYMEFIRSYPETIDLYANLDVIGNAKASWKNQRIMEKAGFNPLPVFHYGSDEKWLFKIMDQYDHFALGGLVPISGNYRAMRDYLDRIWGIISKTNPLPKVHGFGVQNLRLIKRYPWDSVDASSVHMQARYGGVMTETGWKKINPDVNGKESHWLRAKPEEKEVIKNFVESHLDGYSFEEAQGQDKKGILLRCAISIHYITEYVDSLEKTKFETVKTLF